MLSSALFLLGTVTSNIRVSTTVGVLNVPRVRWDVCRFAGRPRILSPACSPDYTKNHQRN